MNLQLLQAAADRQEEEEELQQENRHKTQEDEREHINREAEEIENEQIKYSKAKNLIESLPLDMKQQLLTEINIEENTLIKLSLYLSPWPALYHSCK